MQIHALWFSPTGGTARVADCPQQARVLPAEQYAAVCQMLQKVCAGHRENELFLPAEG